jgi:hypothetical protein
VLPSDKSDASIDAVMSPVLLSDADLAAIDAALPTDIEPRVRRLVRPIFEEWARIELPEHLNRQSPKSRANRRTKVERVAKTARGLAAALAALGDNGPNEIAAWATVGTDDFFAPGKVEDLVNRLTLVSQNLPELVGRAAAAAQRLKARRGRPNTIIAYLVMLDLAAIYEFLTGSPPTRRVRSDVYDDDSGAEYGPFYTFVEAVWSRIAGLIEHPPSPKTLVRDWAEYRRQYNESSTIIANLHLRRPEWGLLGQ